MTSFAPSTMPSINEGALALLKGNLAPDGCVIKPSACEPRFLKHTGPALVFDTYDELKSNINAKTSMSRADHVLVLRNAGPQGAGMPEWGMLPIPTKLVKQGVRDMVRISDARMSGHELRRMHPARGAGILRRRSARLWCRPVT